MVGSVQRLGWMATKAQEFSKEIKVEKSEPLKSQCYKIRCIAAEATRCTYVDRVSLE